MGKLFSYKKSSEIIQFRLNGQQKTSISGQLRHVEMLSTNCNNAETQNATNIDIHVYVSTYSTYIYIICTYVCITAEQPVAKPKLLKNKSKSKQIHIRTYICMLKGKNQNKLHFKFKYNSITNANQLGGQSSGNVAVARSFQLFCLLLFALRVFFCKSEHFQYKKY